MFDYIKGLIKEITPTYIILENNMIGYFVHISLNTYTRLSEGENCLIYIYEVIREDTHQLYGFFDKKERNIFLHLISVSGVGANTARVMLSSLNPDEISSAIMNGNVAVLKSIKGIGTKSAERIIVDLKDKIGKIDNLDQNIVDLDNTIKEEALSALVMLGFPKTKAEKIVKDILKESAAINVEGLVKESLKRI